MLIFSVPSFAKIKSYKTLEYNGFIHMWYHAEDAEPDWTPPELVNISNGNWAFRGRTEHYVNCHIQVCISSWTMTFYGFLSCLFLIISTFSLESISSVFV